MQPRIDDRALLSGHIFELHAHAENPEAAAGMQIDHFALQFARPYAVGDVEMNFRANGNGQERTDVTTSRAQLGNLRGD